MFGSKEINTREAKEKKWRRRGLAVASVVPLVVYVICLAPDVNFEDPVEFALGGATLGVDHPSGYPLETLVAHLFALVPVGGMGWRINLSSAFAGAAAVAFLYLLCWEILTPIVLAPGVRAGAAWCGTAAFAFSRSFWPQTEITEVYGLNAAVIAAALWLAVVAWRGGDCRRLLTGAFVAALGAANHPISLAVTGPALFFAWWRRRPAANRVAFYGSAAVFILLALSVYLYLAVRAARFPPLNWGQPYDVGSWWDHIRRREFGTIYWPRYRWLGFHAAEFLELLLKQYGWGVAALGVAGWIRFVRLPAWVVVGVPAVLAGPAMLFPLVGLLTPIQVFEIEVWYIPFYLIWGVALAVGVGWGLAAAPQRPARVLTWVAALLPLYPLIFNLPYADARHQRLCPEYGRNLLRTYAYQATTSFSFYDRLGLHEVAFQHYVLWRRPDVIIIDAQNGVRSPLAATRRAPRFIREPHAAEAWWLEFRRELWRNEPRPHYYLVREGGGVAGALGVSFVPYGLSYYVRAGGRAALPAAPWSRYEVAALREVERLASKRRARRDPTALRVWALYYYGRAEDYFRAGDTPRGLDVLSRAVKLAAMMRTDPEVEWLLASCYAEYNFPTFALPIYLKTLPRLKRYGADAELFRRYYAGFLNNVAVTYLKVGDVASARRYFEASLAAYPEQPELRVTLTDEALDEAVAYFRSIGAGSRPEAVR